MKSLRKLEEKVQATLPLEDGRMPNPTEPEQPIEKMRVNLSLMMRFGDFSTIAEEEFPPDVYPCALVFDDKTPWREQTLRLLKADSYLVNFTRIVSIEQLKHLSSANETVIWNILGMAADEKIAFNDSTQRIIVSRIGNPHSPCPSPTIVVSAKPDKGSPWPPLAVLHFILKAVSIPGDSILLPTGGPVQTILELGRRPICFDTDKEQHEQNKDIVRAYYANLYSDNVDFI